MFKGFPIILAAALAAVSCVTVPASAEPVTFDLVDMNSPNEAEHYVSTEHQVPIVLEFYFNGCPACERNAANVQRLAVDRHGDQANVVEVGIDDDDEVYADWINRHAPVNPVLKDASRALARRLGVRSYPTTIVLDAAHREVYRTSGVWSSRTYREIEALLPRRQN